MSLLKKITNPRLRYRFLFTFLLLVLLLILAFSLGGNFSGGKNLIINELMASNRIILTDEDSDYPDWFEIYNPGKKKVNLKGYWASSDQEDPLMWAFPNVDIEPGGYLVVFASGKDRFNSESGELHTNFRLGVTGGSLFLIDPEILVLDSITYPAMLANVSYGRAKEGINNWAYFLEASPGAANSGRPYVTVTEMPQAREKHLLINEILTNNRTSLIDEDGDLSDWIELFNSSSSPINLEDYWLSDKAENPFKWRFPSVTIEPDSYLLIFASGKNRFALQNGWLHTNFCLNDQSDTLILSEPQGAVIDTLKIRQMQRNVSYGRDPENPAKWLYFPRPTPGEANYSTGFEKFSESPVPGLLISEAAAVNVAGFSDEDNDFVDWIKIYNPESYAINLEGYGLSDHTENPFRWQFPSVTIAPGAGLLIFASGKNRFDLEKGYLHTNFKLKASGETIVLTHPDGMTIDKMATGKQSANIWAGRLNGQSSGERYFFSTPLSGTNNEPIPYQSYAGAVSITPVGGFYTGAVTVSMAGTTKKAEIRYTLDGAEPGASSPLYNSPFEIDETCVLRARAFEVGRLPGPVENRSYFFNTIHSLTVVSLMLNPQDLWNPKTGIYVKGYGASSRFPYYGANFWKDMEKPVHFELYEPSGKLGLSLNAGLKIGGQFSRGMEQKAFNVFARNIYGFKEIHYPFFVNKDLSTFKAISLRASGQDAVYSLIRDILMTSLLDNTEVDYQGYRQAVLYLNGQYWGIYNIRERINSHFIAGNHGLDPDKIDLLQANWIVREGSNEDYLELLDFVRTNNLATEENYAYIKTRMDVISYIDALIVQIYFAQTDQGNIRYWREQQPGARWRWIIYDLDWGMWPSHVHHNTLAAMTNPAGVGAWGNVSTTLTVKLLQNENFKNEFIERFAWHLKNSFNPERVTGRIDELAANIAGEMPRQTERWGGSLARWEKEIESLRTFARERPAIIVEQLRNKFNLSAAQMQIFY